MALRGEKERRTEGPWGRVHSSWSQQKQLELQDGHGRGWGCSLWNGCLNWCYHQCGREGTTPLSQASQLFLAPRLLGTVSLHYHHPPNLGAQTVTSSLDCPPSTAEGHCLSPSLLPSPEPPSNTLGGLGFPVIGFLPQSPHQTCGAGWDSPCPDFKTAAPPLWIHSFWKYPWWPLCPGPGNDSDYALRRVPTQLKILFLPPVPISASRRCWPRQA